MMNKKLLLIALLVFLSCNDKNDLYSLIESKYYCDSTIIDIGEITEFSWDKMYVTKCISLENLNHTIGFEYIYFTDIAERIIFVRDNRVVYHEDIFPDPAAKSSQRVIFIYPNDTTVSMCFSKDNARFVVKKDNQFFVLTPIQKEETR